MLRRQISRLTRNSTSSISTQLSPISQLASTRLRHFPATSTVAAPVTGTRLFSSTIVRGMSSQAQVIDGTATAA